MCSLTICCSTLDFTLSVAGKGGGGGGGENSFPAARPVPVGSPPSPVQLPMLAMMGDGKAPTAASPQRTGRAAAPASLSPCSPFKRAIVRPMAAPRHGCRWGQLDKIVAKITQFPSPPHPRFTTTAAGAAGWAGSDGVREDFCSAARYFALA